MCYSAKIKSEFGKYVRETGAKIDLETFVAIYWERRESTTVKIPKAIDLQFLAHEAQTDAGKQIQAMIREFDAAQASKLEQGVFKQKKRQADAQRILRTKTTKKAQEDVRISTDKIEWALGKLADIKRTELKPRDERIFPGWYAPVIVMENGQRVVKPMRYQCRPAGKPAFYDTKYPGTYNARKDNLEGFWKGLYGYSHGIMWASAFFENVARHTMEHRELAEGEKEENVILEFKARGMDDMLVACLWSKWVGEDGAELLSFAAITDEPPEEVRAAGHDRCIIPIKPEHVDAWLSPNPANLAVQYAILDDRERPYYEHRAAA